MSNTPAPDAAQTLKAVRQRARMAAAIKADSITADAIQAEAAPPPPPEATLAALLERCITLGQGTFATAIYRSSWESEEPTYDHVWQHNKLELAVRWHAGTTDPEVACKTLTLVCVRDGDYRTITIPPCHAGPLNVAARKALAAQHKRRLQAEAEQNARSAAAAVQRLLNADTPSTGVPHDDNW